MHPACVLPFNAIAKHHPVDDACGPDGNGAQDSPQALQNDEKNNFCAAGPPVNVTFDVLHQLQEVAAGRVTFGSDKSLPQDRSPLQKIPTTVGEIGEGNVVRLAAFVINAHPSNVGAGKGESVNCKEEDAEGNDIHIVLGENSNSDDECSSATAEMSPHFRPDFWTPQNLNENNSHKYRFTGHLFFDGSHKPCANGRGSPKRSTLWEIHPVYGVDICMLKDNSCVVDMERGWEPLDQFLGSDSSETRLHPPVLHPVRPQRRMQADLAYLFGPLQKKW
jgi:hypothetical protein